MGFKTFAAAGVISLAAFTSGNAFAADMPYRSAPPMPVPVAAPVEFGAWYLRGDVGVSAYDGGKITGADLPASAFHGEELGSGAFAGFGVGYQFNRWFRADVTGEYRFSTGFKGQDKTADDYGVYRNFYEGKFDSTVGLVNGYFDLGTWYGLTPFVGAGVGVAYNRMHGLKESGISDNFATASYGAYTGVSGGDIGEATKTNLAWALHAGLAYDVTPNFKVELAYRYLNLGEAKTGVINCFCGATYAGLKVRDIESHDIKLGMRWVLGGASVPMAAMEAPLVRRY